MAKWDFMKVGADGWIKIQTFFNNFLSLPQNIYKVCIFMTHSYEWVSERGKKPINGQKSKKICGFLSWTRPQKTLFLRLLKGWGQNSTLMPIHFRWWLVRQRGLQLHLVVTAMGAASLAPFAVGLLAALLAIVMRGQTIISMKMAI